MDTNRSRKPVSWRLPAGLEAALNETLQEWQRGGKTDRLWARDAALWSGSDEADWLGWLDAPHPPAEYLDDLRGASEQLLDRNIRHAVLLGMGGSSMAPEVVRETFGHRTGYPDLHVLDSTDPAQVKAVEDAVDLESTVFIVASKSGSTLEPNILLEYFFARVCEVAGRDSAPGQFIAITDPGSSLEATARERNFFRIFHGRPDIGGRYSALSGFGLVPAVVIGVDVQRLLHGAGQMARDCGPSVPAGENPGVVLGCIIGEAANAGRDKVTLIASPGIEALGAWLEQLLAESTGKQGKAVITVDGEAPGSPGLYGSDRLFVYLRLATGVDPEQDAAVEALREAGHAVVTISVPGAHALGQEFFRWEMATAVAGSVMGINPFDQPDVEASKVATRKLTAAYESSGSLPAETPFAEGEGLKIFSDARNIEALRKLVGGKAPVDELILAHLSRATAGDYVALLAYLARNAAHDEQLQIIRHHIRDRQRLATCVGFGPRFLHSTGQAFKGGPNTGVFLQITADDAVDLDVPGHGYTFGIVKAAQARGDFEVLVERERRALRVHLGKDTVAGLKTLVRIISAL